MATKFLTAAALTLSCAPVAFACDGPSNMLAYYIDLVFHTQFSSRTNSVNQGGPAS